jgi:hypothetical protein
VRQRHRHPAREQEQMCQLFFATKPTGEGTGLGLSISRFPASPAVRRLAARPSMPSASVIPYPVSAMRSAARWDIVTQQHGGTMMVDSRVGEFTIRLPRIHLPTAEQDHECPGRGRRARRGWAFGSVFVVRPPRGRMSCITPRQGRRNWIGSEVKSSPRWSRFSPTINFARGRV